MSTIVKLLFNKATTASVVVAAIMKTHFEGQGLAVDLREVYNDTDLARFEWDELVYLANLYPSLLQPEHYVHIRIADVGKYVMHEHDVPGTVPSKVYIPVIKDWEEAERLTKKELALVHEVRKQAYLTVGGRAGKFSVAATAVENNGYRNYEILQAKAKSLMETFGDVHSSGVSLNVHPEMFEYVTYAAINILKMKRVELYYFYKKVKLEWNVEWEENDGLTFTFCHI